MKTQPVVIKDDSIQYLKKVGKCKKEKNDYGYFPCYKKTDKNLFVYNEENELDSSTDFHTRDFFFLSVLLRSPKSLYP